MTDHTHEAHHAERSPVSRRTLAAGAAWSVPAIAFANAAPAMAISGPPPTFTFTGACKSPGNSCTVFPKGYEFRFTVCNNTPLPIYLYGVSYSVSGTNLTLTHATPTLPYLLQPNLCVNVVFRSDSSNSSNQVFTATLTIPWGHNPTAPDPHNHPPVVLTFQVPATPPDCACTATPNP